MLDGSLCGLKYLPRQKGGQRNRSPQRTKHLYLPSPPYNTGAPVPDSQNLHGKAETGGGSERGIRLPTSPREWLESPKEAVPTNSRLLVLSCQLGEKRTALTGYC